MCQTAVNPQVKPKLYTNKYIKDLDLNIFSLHYFINHGTECKLFNSNLVMICKVIMSISTKVILIRTNETH